VCLRHAPFVARHTRIGRATGHVKEGADAAPLQDRAATAGARLSAYSIDAVTLSDMSDAWRTLGWHAAAHRQPARVPRGQAQICPHAGWGRFCPERLNPESALMRPVNIGGSSPVAKALRLRLQPITPADRDAYPCLRQLQRAGSTEVSNSHFVLDSHGRRGKMSRDIDARRSRPNRCSSRRPQHVLEEWPQFLGPLLSLS
jgi:hypothetical protein